MTDLVERVAMALAEHGGDNWETCLKAPGLRRAGMYRAIARAAIAAMREPTEAMCERGSGVTWWDGKDDEEWEENVSTFTAKDIYQAMIDEALK